LTRVIDPLDLASHSPAHYPLTLGVNARVRVRVLKFRLQLRRTGFHHWRNDRNLRPRNASL